jgi:hypothetical protein
VQVVALLLTVTHDTSRGGEQEGPRIALRGGGAATKPAPLRDRHVQGDGAFENVDRMLAA